MGCHTSEVHQAHIFHGLNNSNSCKHRARDFHSFGYWDEEESIFQMVYDLLNSEELFGKYVKFLGF